MRLRPGARFSALPRRHGLAYQLVVVCALAVVLACQADPGYQGRPSASWVAQLADGATLDARADAAVALGHVLDLQPNDRAAVAALVAAIADTNDALRVTAAHALTGAGRGGRRTRAVLPGAVPGLVTLLADSAHPSVRADAAGVLGALGTSTGPAGARALAGALRDPNAAVRGAAADALSEVGAAARVAWPALDTALRRVAQGDPAAANRRAALAALARTQAPDTVLVPALVQGVADASPDVRVAAATTLGLAGAVGDPQARAALTRALADADPGVRQEARHALTALHRRGGQDPAPPEPSLIEQCARTNYRGPKC